MEPPRPSLDDIIDACNAVGRARSLRASFDLLLAAADRLFGARGSVVINRGRWTIAASTSPDTADRLEQMLSVVDPIRREGPTVLQSPRHPDEEPWTAVLLDACQEEDRPPLVAVFVGDWTGNASFETWAAIAKAAIVAVRERTLRDEAEHDLIETYAVARRLSRFASVEHVYQWIVDQVARSIGADRVTLAIYRPSEDCLIVEATTRDDDPEVKHVRIEPGSWVIGHVFASGRPTLVRDVHRARGMASRHARYRTGSFAAVPVFAGSEPIGVLAATDKLDGSAFDRDDLGTLRLIAGVAALAIVAARSAEEVGRLAFAATVDSLTGLHNRQYLDDRLRQEVERAKRGGHAFAVLMADIDDFKAINDTYGHQRGDAVLQAIGGILRTAVRVFDVCARYGGDEFAILMPSSDALSAATCAERIRRRVAAYAIREGHVPPLRSLTMSIGVAVTKADDTPADVMRRADQYLYQAKVAGKNRVSGQIPAIGVQRLLPGDRHKESS